MKTQVIQLSSNEDYISVRDRLGWMQAKRILLVWPEQGQALHRKLDLKLVERHADSLGATIALVTRDAHVRFWAGQLGIQVFETAVLAQDAQWNDHQHPVIIRNKIVRREKLDNLRFLVHPKGKAWQNGRTTRVVSMALAALALLSLTIFILPGARVSIAPRMESQSMVFDLIADPTINSINYSTGSLPSYSLDVIAEGTDSLAASGTVSMPDKPALGSLRFTNYSDQPVRIPTGVIVSTIGADPVRFITTETIEDNLPAGESILIPARAMDPGISGNVAEDELVSLEGDQGLDLVVTNPQAMTGGSQVSVPAPTSQDLMFLRQRLQNKLIQEVIAQLQSNLPKGDILVTTQDTNVDILVETSFPALGEPGNLLELTLQLRVHGQVVPAVSLHNLVIPVMDAYTPAGYTYRENSLQIDPITSPALQENGTTSWTVRATRQLQANIPGDKAVQLVMGLSKGQADQKLAASLPINGEARIILFPSWWPRLPLLAMRIEISQETLQ